MNRLVVFLSFFLLLMSCGKKGCMEPLADNYNPSAKKKMEAVNLHTQTSQT